MAVRRVTRTFPDLKSWLQEYPSGLAVGALNIPAGVARGELAGEVKVDLVVPLLGRIGPLTGQVVHRGPDGSTALRLPSLDAEAGQQLKSLQSAIEEIKDWLVSSGELLQGDGRPDPRDARIRELETELAELRTLLDEAEDLLEEEEQAREDGVEPTRRRSRGFGVPDVRGIPPTISGSMEDRSLRDAMVQLALDRVTGLLTLTRPDGVVRHGFWYKGGPSGLEKRTSPGRGGARRAPLQGSAGHQGAASGEPAAHGAVRPATG